MESAWFYSYCLRRIHLAPMPTEYFSSFELVTHTRELQSLQAVNALRSHSVSMAISYYCSSPKHQTVQESPRLYHRAPIKTPQMKYINVFISVQSTSKTPSRSNTFEGIRCIVYSDPSIYLHVGTLTTPGSCSIVVLPGKRWKAVHCHTSSLDLASSIGAASKVDPPFWVILLQ